MNGRRRCSNLEWLDDHNYAKLKCAENKKCIGIEVRDHLYFGICMGALCTSRSHNNDGNSTILFFKKQERYGKLK